jgi:hypothetical protein
MPPSRDELRERADAGDVTAQCEFLREGAEAGSVEAQRCPNSPPPTDVTGWRAELVALLEHAAELD